MHTACLLVLITCFCFSHSWKKTNQYLIRNSDNLSETRCYQYFYKNIRRCRLINSRQTFKWHLHPSAHLLYFITSARNNWFKKNSNINFLLEIIDHRNFLDFITIPFFGGGGGQLRNKQQVEKVHRDMNVGHVIKSWEVQTLKIW